MPPMLLIQLNLNGTNEFQQPLAAIEHDKLRHNTASLLKALNIISGHFLICQSFQ